MITYLSADNGKLQLHDDTKNGIDVRATQKK